MGNPPALSARAGVAYAVTVFAIGFVLGTARVLLLAPHLGATIAVSIEAPIILTASWYVSSTWMKRLVVEAEIRTRSLVGAVAFVTLMILEVALSIGLFHRSIGEYFAGLVSLAGAIGLAAQVCFATFPLLDVVLRRRSNLLSRAPLWSGRSRPRSGPLNGQPDFPDGGPSGDLADGRRPSRWNYKMRRGCGTAFRSLL